MIIKLGTTRDKNKKILLKEIPLKKSKLSWCCIKDDTKTALLSTNSGDVFQQSYFC